MIVSPKHDYSPGFRTFTVVGMRQVLLRNFIELSELLRYNLFDSAQIQFFR